MNLQSKVKLNSGAEIPVLGLGVFRSKDGEETYNAVRWALDNLKEQEEEKSKGEQP